MKKVLIATLLVLSFIVYSSDIHAQSNRSVEQIINLYDNATDWNTLNELIGSLTVEERRALQQSDTHSWIAEKTPDPEYIEEVLSSGGEIENYGFYADDYGVEVPEDVWVPYPSDPILSGDIIQDNQNQQDADDPDNQNQPIDDNTQNQDDTLDSRQTPQDQVFNEDEFFEKMDSLDSCFDYYTFGSVDAKLFTDVSEVTSGVKFNFGLEVTNNNPYPVVENDILIRIYRQQDDQSIRPVNGDHIVEEFYAAENISLDAGQQREYQFDWQIPSLVKSGSYYAVSYVVSSDRYNLLGLTFTDDIAGDKTFFDIVGAEDGVYFDRNSVKINNQDHQLISYPPSYPKEDEILVEAEIVNESSLDEVVEVKWDLYWWDYMSEDNMVDTLTRTYEVPAYDSVTVSYQTSENDKSVYLLKSRFEQDDVESILNVRFVRDGVDIPRVNFPGVDSYPLQEGENINLFSCLHNTNYSDVNNVDYEIIVEDLSGNLIDEYKYNGFVTGAMMGIQDSFVPQNDIKNFKIKSNLYKDGKLIESDELVYLCKDINPDLCNTTLTSNRLLYIIFGGLIGIFIIWFLFNSFLKNRKTKKITK